VEARQKAKLLKKFLDGQVLPSLSPLTIRLVELAADDRSSARDLAEIIEKDPGLATRLLKLVGSAFFARKEKVSSISQAVVLLGFQRVRVMALSLSLRETFPLNKRDGMDYNLFWKTSLYRALIARSFSQAGPLSVSDLNPEEAFVGGLILEIGMLMLHAAMKPETMKIAPLGGGLPLEEVIDWENKNLGITHREVGSHIMRRWRFSDPLVATQSFFGARALAPDTPLLCKIVELARRATEIMCGHTADLYALQQDVQTFLNLEPEVVNAILSEAFEKVEDVAEHLCIAVSSQADIVTVMEKANQALARINSSMETSFQGFLAQVKDYDRSVTTISEEMAHRRGKILQNTLDAVAHEIRNPLLAIGGFARRLAGQGPQQARGGHYARIIAEESARLERVLKEIVDYTQSFEPGFVEEDLISLVDEVLDQFQVLVHEKKISLIREFPPEPLLVPVDVDGITMVLRQLLKNAMSNVSQEEGTVTVSAQSFPQSGLVSISISDNGPPLSDDIRDALLDSNLSAKTFSGGLGLPKARKIVEAHNGRIELRARGNYANTRIIHLPTSQTP
jgi:HD-like signal output (HDOD) protein